MDSSKGALSSLQKDFLEAWFKRTAEFFLTGGAVLVGFLGAPRLTKDLDLFTTNQEAFEDATHLLNPLCKEIGAYFQPVRTAPYFRRFLVTRDDSETVIDIVLDSAPQVFARKQLTEEGFTIDVPEEILINKICSIVGRSEPRDFFDIFFLSSLNFDKEKALKLAQEKDGGVDEEALLFILSSITWKAFTIPGADESTVKEVRAFFQGWAETLALNLFPGGK